MLVKHSETRQRNPHSDTRRLLQTQLSRRLRPRFDFHFRYQYSSTSWDDQDAVAGGLFRAHTFRPRVHQLCGKNQRAFGGMRWDFTEHSATGTSTTDSRCGVSKPRTADFMITFTFPRQESDENKATARYLQWAELAMPTKQRVTDGVYRGWRRSVPRRRRPQARFRLW